MALLTWLNGDLFSALRDKTNAAINALNPLIIQDSQYNQASSVGNFQITFTGSNITNSGSLYTYIRNGNIVNMYLATAFTASAGNLGYGTLRIILPAGLKAKASKIRIPGYLCDNNNLSNEPQLATNSSGDFEMSFDSSPVSLGAHNVTILAIYELQ